MLNNFLTKFCTISLRCTVGKIESSIPHMQCRWNQSLWVASAFYQDSSIAASSRMIRKLLVQNTLQDWRFISSFTVAVIICFFLTNHSTKLLISSPLLPELEQELETHEMRHLNWRFVFVCFLWCHRLLWFPCDSSRLPQLYALFLISSVPAFVGVSLF